MDARIAESLQTWGFSLRCWSRTHKLWSNAEGFVNTEGLDALLSQTRILVDLLPNTAGTVDIINVDLLGQLQDGAYVLDLARGVHLNENDLLALLGSDKMKGVMLDAYGCEPLLEDNLLWKCPRVIMTPHITTAIRPAGAMDYISHTTMNLESGRVTMGQVNRVWGY